MERSAVGSECSSGRSNAAWQIEQHEKHPLFKGAGQGTRVMCKTMHGDHSHDMLNYVIYIYICTKCVYIYILFIFDLHIDMLRCPVEHMTNELHRQRRLELDPRFHSSLSRKVNCLSRLPFHPQHKYPMPSGTQSLALYNLPAASTW